MSFSRTVKEELATYINPARHCQLAELAALIHFGGHLSEDGQHLLVEIENESVARKCFTLLQKTYNIDTDVWVSMGDEAEKAQREKDLAPYQVNQELMDIANDGAIFMHCLPAVRGQEVSAEVIDGPQSVIYDEAENRLHAQKAVLYYYLKD